MNVVLEPRRPPRSGLGDTPDLPPDPQAKYDQYNSPQGQAGIKAQANQSITAFVEGLGSWVQGGSPPPLPSKDNLGAIAASTAIAFGQPALGAAIMLAFAQADLEAQVFAKYGVPTWARVAGVISGLNPIDIINAAYSGLSSIWGGGPSGCQLSPPDCSQPPPAGPGAPGWKSISSDADYCHASWVLAELHDLDSGQPTDGVGRDISHSKPEVQFREFFDHVLLSLWEASINCKMPPPDDRAVLVNVARMWNTQFDSSATFTFQPVPIDPGHNWFDWPFPYYINWLLSSGESGNNMNSSAPGGPLTLNTGGFHPPSGGGTININKGHPLNAPQPPAATSTTAGKIAKGAAVVSGGAVLATVLYALVKKQSVGYVWGKIWSKTKSTARKVSRL